MKKYFLSAFVIISFIAYSLTMRQTDSRAVVAKPTAASPDTSTSNSSSNSTPTAATQTAAAYKDGKYTGKASDAVYGNIQVRATIQGGRITSVEFLQYPNDRRNSVEINQQAMPLLQQEAIQAQTSKVNGVSGATDTSQAFVQSLASALSQAA
jgi:uncharacterized protein with FMN-binding domain